jgi:hypothetical protein
LAVELKKSAICDGAKYNSRKLLAAKEIIYLKIYSPLERLALLSLILPFGCLSFAPDLRLVLIHNLLKIQ